MATAIVTFFLFVRFYVYKMDADWIDSQRDQFLSRREKRWSMNSQRLEAIVAELMKPIYADRRSFDTDLSALLEEYLTEAGLHALDAAEAGDSSGHDSGHSSRHSSGHSSAHSSGYNSGHSGEIVGDFTIPNFPEIALLLQQSAAIYGYKVDFLYQHVLHVSDFLHSSTNSEEASASAPEEPATPSASSSRRKRKASAHVLADFEEIVLEPCPAATRDAEAPRPPPTLPRVYVELEPRLACAADTPLRDYAEENIGLLSDFQVTWRLHEGLLVDELEGGSPRGDSALRPISLVELQAAIEAAAPSSPPRGCSPVRDLSPLHASTPLPTGDVEPASLSMPPPVKKERKRRSEVKIDDIFNGSVKIVISKDLMRKLREVREFSISEQWITRIVEKRKSHILSERKRLLDEETQPPDEGFAGWPSSEAAQALQAAALAEPDSDDDGFFEQSSGGGDPELAAAAAAAGAGAGAAAWRAASLQRAAAAEARGAPDVRALGRQVLRALGDDARPTPLARLLRDQARHETDVSRLVLASLFLATAGNIEIVPGAPLSVDSCALRLRSRDLRQYALALAQDQRLLHS